MCFEVVGGLVAEGGVAPLVLVLGNVMRQFQPRFCQAGKAATVEQFGFEPALKGLGLGVVAVATPAPALLSAVLNEQIAEASSRIRAALI